MEDFRPVSNTSILCEVPIKLTGAEYSVLGAAQHGYMKIGLESPASCATSTKQLEEWMRVGRLKNVI